MCDLQDLIEIVTFKVLNLPLYNRPHCLVPALSSTGSQALLNIFPAIVVDIAISLDRGPEAKQERRAGSDVIIAGVLFGDCMQQDRVCRITTRTVPTKFIVPSPSV